jgi:hypothetical protein
MTSEQAANDNAVLGYLTGATLKGLNEAMIFDDDLDPIQDDELYVITLKGIFRVTED